MNYIKHINHWMELVSVDDRLTAYHISMYLALFQLWNKSRFAGKITIFRDEVLQLSKIGSSRTYYKCLHDLHALGYIQYAPSFNPMKGSTVTIVELSDTENGQPGEGSDINTPEDGTCTADENPKNFCLSAPNTEVEPKQNQQSSSSKNDTGANQVVTPFIINNINLLNSKHRERHARKKNEVDISLKNDNCLAVEKKKKEGGETFLPSGVAASSRLASIKKRNVAQNFIIPSLNEIKRFFSSTDISELTGSSLTLGSLELEAVKFFHHFESNGWLVGGRSPMCDWQAACKSWIAKIPYFNRNKTNQNRLHMISDHRYGEPL